MPFLFFQPPQDKLAFPLTFKWEKQTDLPQSTTSDNLCIVNNKVYINSGNSIYEYTPETGTWVELPTPIENFGIVSLNGKLTLVGGMMKGPRRYTRAIRAWDSDSKQWTEPYPPMPMGRSDLGCSSYQHYLIIAGGATAERPRRSTTSVEILDTKTNQWFKAPPMRCDGKFIQSMVIGQFLYILPSWYGVLTSSKSLLRVSLPTLISYTLQGKNHDTSIWEKMPDVPHYNTTIFSIGNMLLTAGGNHSGTVGVLLSVMHVKDTKVSGDIHLFNPHTNQWLKIGELPESRMTCACTVLPCGKMLVAGGEGVVRASGSLLSTVYTATISGSYFEPPL
jgi:hypothetical protein